MSQPLPHTGLDTAVLEELEASDAQEVRVLVVRLGAMGDIIHGLPAIFALRSAYPNLKIGWLVERRWSELLCAELSERLQPRSSRKPLVDWLHISDFKGWRKHLSSRATWDEMRRSLSEVRAMKYDVALDLQGSIRSAAAARLSGARTRIGSQKPREAPARHFYTSKVPIAADHVVEHALTLASALAAQKFDYQEPEFPQDETTEAWADQFWAAAGLAPLAIVNPGAGWGAKCWPVDSYGAVARALADRGMAVVINFGPGEESLADAVRLASHDIARPVQCSISQLIALTRRASLFVGGDTGPMHLAAALNVPVVALFGPTRPERNGPYATRSVVLRSPDSVDNMSHVGQPDAGLLSIQPAAVIAAADFLLKEQHD